MSDANQVITYNSQWLEPNVVSVNAATSRRRMKMKHFEDKIYATATINAENGRLALNLFHDTDHRYRWYEAAGADTEISGEGPTDAEEAAEKAWHNWGFLLGPRIPFTHGATLKECMNCGAELDGTENPADFCDSDCEANYYEED